MNLHRNRAFVRSFLAFAAGAMIVALAAHVVAQRTDAFVESRDHPAIRYSSRPTRDLVAHLNEQISAGALTLDFDSANGYLRSTLQALGVPISSQSLVFSGTSAQSKLISMRNPRAIYFADTVAVGWVPGADALEVAAQDPEQGVVFYTLPQSRAAKPRFTRDESCLLCHLTWDSLGVPGLTALTTFPMSDDPHAYASGFAVDHRTSIDQRWGGWYVTGTAGSPHMGNIPVVVPAAELNQRVPTPQLASMAGKIDDRAYLTLHSDVVALMVLEHQTHMTNLITRLGWEARVAAAGTRVANAARDLVDYLLFVDEAPLSGQIQGSSGFAAEFAARGPRDRKGRSLRELDLKTRLLRYRCSYMIYTPAFDALPPAALDAVYRRLWQILSGAEEPAQGRSVPLADRQAIVEILRDTKPQLPSYFQPVAR